MAKKTKKSVESTENMVNELEAVDADYEGPETHLSNSEESAPEAVAEVKTNEYAIVEGDTEEVIAQKQIIEQKNNEAEALKVALKAVNKEIAAAKKAVNALVKGEKPKASNIKYVFIATDTPITEIKTVNGKPLSYQGRLLLQIFVPEGTPAGTELSYTKEEILQKLEENYPCVGDKFDNFAWYKSQILKPIGLMK
jgi:hypothetical protein